MELRLHPRLPVLLERHLFSEIQILSTRLRTPSNTGPSIFRHDLQVNTQLLHLVSSHNNQSSTISPPRHSHHTIRGGVPRTFHTSFGLPFTSIDIISVTSFITYAPLVLNIRTSTIHVYLSGINFIVKLLSGAPTPSISHPHINMLIKGRLPLTSDLLVRCKS